MEVTRQNHHKVLINLIHKYEQQGYKIADLDWNHPVMITIQNEAKRHVKELVNEPDVSEFDDPELANLVKRAKLDNKGDIRNTAILELNHLGYLNLEIAHILNISASSVSSLLSRKGLTANTKYRFMIRKPTSKTYYSSVMLIADKMGLKERTVQRYFRLMQDFEANGELVEPIPPITIPDMADEDIAVSKAGIIKVGSLRK